MGVVNIKNNFIKFTIQMMTSNMLSLFTSSLSAILIPLILTKDQYGMYRSFLIYVPYLAIFHFGFVDGILISESGKEKSELNRSKFNLYSKFFIILEFFVFAFIFVISWIFVKNLEMRLMIYMICFYGLISNIVTYYQYISRSVFEFNELSKVNAVQSLVNLFFLILSFVLYKVYGDNFNYSYYVIGSILAYLVMLIYYLFKYSEFTFGKSDYQYFNLDSMINIFKSGIVLTLSFEVMTVMFNLDNQLMSYVLNKKEYATYSFSYSMTAIIISLFSAL